MKRYLLKFYIILIISFNSSCRELVQDEFTEFNNIITVNSIIKANDTINLYVSLTDELNNHQLQSVDNAEIKMYNQDSILIIFFHTENGLYISDYVAQENDRYDLKIEVPNFGVVSSNCIVPEFEKLYNVNLNGYAWINDEGRINPEVSFSVLNNQSIDKYYEAIIKSFRRNSLTDTVYYLYNEFSIGLFDNILENNDTINKKIKFQRGWDESELYSFQLILRSVDYNYFQYANSYYRYQETRFPSFSNTSIIPINLYSNITDGYGIMGTYFQCESNILYP